MIRGNAPGLRSDEYIWLFDYDPNDPNHFWRVNPIPLNVPNGEWAYTSSPIGDPGTADICTVYYLVAIRASAMNYYWQHSRNADGDITCATLRAGCPNPLDPNDQYADMAVYKDSGVNLFGISSRTASTISTVCLVV